MLLILTPIFLLTITPTTTVPSSCTDVNELSVFLSSSPLHTAVYPSSVFSSENSYVEFAANDVAALKSFFVTTLSTPSLLDESADV